MTYKVNITNRVGVVKCIIPFNYYSDESSQIARPPKGSYDRNDNDYSCWRWSCRSDLERSENIREQIGQRLDLIGQRLDLMDGRLDQMDKRFDQVDARFEKLEMRMGTMERQQAKLEGLLEGLRKAISGRAPASR